MKIKLKTGENLSNNWKSCGCSISDWSDLVDVQIATKSNIGLVLKAASGTTSIFCAGVCRAAASGDHTVATNVDIRLGFVKD